MGEQRTSEPLGYSGEWFLVRTTGTEPQVHAEFVLMKAQPAGKDLSRLVFGGTWVNLPEVSETHDAARAAAIHAAKTRIDEQGTP